MKKYLPKSSNNSSGFTLIELLVVIAIIAIISVVGIATFTGIQSRARDTKRISDITAMSKAMEAHYVAGTGYTTPLVAGWFADGAIPTNPAPGGAAYNTNAPTATTYLFCAALENSTGNSSSSTAFSTAPNAAFFCKSNQQ